MSNPPLTFIYTNWRGETAVRRATPIRVEFAATDWHPEPQWLLIAHDEEKNAERSFAMKDIVFGGCECKARPYGNGGGDPVDCDWPMCGCDPRADKVIAALQEADLLK